MQTINTPNNVIYSWCPNIEQGAFEQMDNIAQLPFVRHCALMPDAHTGMSMPIGGVVATEGVIVPNFVGVDIGCGVCAVKTSLKREDIMNEELRMKIHHSINREIPMGFQHNNQKRKERIIKEYSTEIFYTLTLIFKLEKHPLNNNIDDAVTDQLGTLGGGNHFIEIQYDENDAVWIMLHSGSRNIGKKICDYYNEIAKNRNELWYSNNRGIPFLPINEPDGQDYITHMNFALHFAQLNRHVMMQDIKRCLKYDMGYEIKYDIDINIHHNYAALENHLGKNVCVHRKGATAANEETTGIIPGSMGTSSYIVKGLANKLSLKSCSHGAGRSMGRKAFNLLYNTPEKIQEIEDKLIGVVYSKFGRSGRGRDIGMKDVSEAPQAYKDIEDVMDNQKDLVTILHKLKPLISWKSNDNVD